MTGGAGFSRDAMNRSRKNRDLRASQKGHDIYRSAVLPEESDELKFPAPNTEAFKKSRNEATRRNVYELRLAGFIVVVLFALIFYLLF